MQKVTVKTDKPGIMPALATVLWLRPFHFKNLVVPQTHPPTDTPEYHAERKAKAQARRERRYAARITNKIKSIAGQQSI